MWRYAYVDHWVRLTSTISCAVVARVPSLTEAVDGSGQVDADLPGLLTLSLTFIFIRTVAVPISLIALRADAPVWAFSVLAFAVISGTYIYSPKQTLYQLSSEASEGGCFDSKSMCYRQTAHTRWPVRTCRGHPQTCSNQCCKLENRRNCRSYSHNSTISQLD